MKKALALTLISALLASALAGTLLVNSVTANFGFLQSVVVPVTITSPENKTYPDGNVPLAFTVNLSNGERYYAFYRYRFIHLLAEWRTDEFFPKPNPPGDLIYCSTTLKGIPEGSYNLQSLLQTNYRINWLG